VFRAYEPENDRLVAVKVFRLDLPPERVHQLVGEFERLIDAGIRHASIATPVATGLNGVVAYLAQDYFSGDSLDIVMREKGTMPVAETLSVARQLAEGLDFAAERHVEHGALNPRDILISPECACIVGIGVTRALEHIGAATPIRRPYTSPERVGGESWDRRADVFSLAAVVYEMLWGRRLVGTGMQAVETMTPLRGTHLAALQAVFAGALAEQAVDRFATAAEFVESLERAINEESAEAEADEAPSFEPLPSRSRDSFRMLEPERAGVAELRLPLEDDLPPVEPELPEPVIELRELEPEPTPPAHTEPGPGFASTESMDSEHNLDLREFLTPQEPREPRAPRELREPPDPLKSAPPFLTSTPAFSTPSSTSSSVVWPIGLACVIGLAVGFGVGYTVAIREQVPAPAVATLPEASEVSPPVKVPAAEPQTAAPAAQPEAIPGTAASPSLPPAPAFAGRLVVRSTPAGARVIVDGRDRGASPAAVSGLKQGEHRVRVLHDGYTAAERRVVLSTSQPSLALTVPLAKAPVAPVAPVPSPVATKPASGQPTKADAAPKTSADAGLAAPKLGAKATAEAGSLVLDSRPTGATAFVDGRPVGTTPLTMPDVKAGDHTVRFELEEHRSWAGSIKVVGGTTNRVGGSLEKID
jgi:serine/threonine protein kinase